jgi:hypothetical protein
MRVSLQERRVAFHLFRVIPLWVPNRSTLTFNSYKEKESVKDRALAFEVKKGLFRERTPFYDEQSKGLLTSGPSIPSH